MFKGSDTKLINGERVKCLLVGINYTGTRDQLSGCINDVLTIEQLIRSNYQNAQLELLTDDTSEKPTRDNILQKLRQLVSTSQPGDILIFSYSGHGIQVPDINGDPLIEIAQTVCPIDFMDKRVIFHQGKRLLVDKQIVDDEIREIIDDVPSGVKFLMLTDTCNLGSESGPSRALINIYNSQLPMPYQLQTQQPIQGSVGSIQSAKPSKLQWFSSWLHHKKDPQDLLVSSYYDPFVGKHYHFNPITGEERTLNMRSPVSCYGGELRIINGYRDDQNSVDIGRNGACTMAFLETVKYLGGFQNFLEKLFSINVQDLKLVEDRINNFLSKFEFTQDPACSWKSFSYVTPNPYTYSPLNMQATPVIRTYPLPAYTVKKRKFANAAQLHPDSDVYQQSDAYPCQENPYSINNYYQLVNRSTYKLT